MFVQLILLTLTSLVIMIIVDYLIGPKAEFLNAYTALQQLFNVKSDNPDSFVASRLGSAGELLVVILVNMLIGGLLTVIYRLLIRR